MLESENIRHAYALGHGSPIEIVHEGLLVMVACSDLEAYEEVRSRLETIRPCGTTKGWIFDHVVQCAEHKYKRHFVFKA